MATITQQRVRARPARELTQDKLDKQSAKPLRSIWSYLPRVHTQWQILDHRRSKQCCSCIHDRLRWRAYKYRWLSGEQSYNCRCGRYQRKRRLRREHSWCWIRMISSSLAPKMAGSAHTHCKPFSSTKCLLAVPYQSGTWHFRPIAIGLQWLASKYPRPATWQRRFSNIRTVKLKSRS